MTGTGTLSGNIAAGQSVTVRGQNAGGNATVTASAGFSNAGTIRMDALEGGYSATLAMTAGALTNLPTGVIETKPGAGGPRTISANVRNEGIVDIDAATTVSSLEAAAGSVLRGHSTITLSSGTLANAGNISPGTSPGRLTVGAALSQQGSGAVTIEIGGPTAVSQYDQLAVSSSVTLDGTLNVALINGFEPALGQTFDIFTFPSRTGVFATTNGLSIGNGKRFQVHYEPTRVRLQVVAE
jgi:hypothetical protein